jgi:DDE superfamily endonuclease
LTRLIVARNKTVSGINAEFVNTTDQSCLNRFLTEAEWDVEQINARRLELLQDDPTTRYSDRGVIALDDVLIDHDGKLIEDVGWFWDHAEQRSKIAHDYLFVDYVCQSGKHYPLEFRRFKKREQCEETGELFEDHGVLFRQLIDWVCERIIPGDFTFDSYFCNRPFC